MSSRRMFLRGAGGSLMAIPFLPSLLPRAARAAATPPKRFVAISADLGVYENLWYPANFRQRQLPAGQAYTAQDLTSLPGSVSNILGTPFDDLKAKLLLIRGLDSALHYPNSNGHMRSTTLTGTLLNKGQPGESIDVILSRSSKVKSPTTPLPYVNGGVVGENHAYTVDGGVMKSPFMHQDAQQFFDLLFTSTGAIAPDQGAMLAQKKKRLIDAVLEDYRRVGASTKLAAADKRVVDEFVTHFNSLETRLRSWMPLRCQVTARTFEPAAKGDPAQYERRLKDMLDTLSLALKCGVLQVAHFGLPTPEISSPPPESNYAIFRNLDAPGVAFTAPAHTYSHEEGGNPRQTNPIYQRWLAGFAAYFMKSLDVPEGAESSTFLDNSFVLFHNNLSNGSLHLRYDLPTLVGGSLGGRFVTGKFLDYTQNVRHTVQNSDGRFVGVDYNRWLVTILRGFGLEEADYQQPGQPPGFGSDYRHGGLHAALDTSKRREPLPGILRQG